MHKQLICIFYLLITGTCYCQSISGRIGSGNQPLALVNISLLKTTDSSIVRTAVTDAQGVFLIEHIAAGVYLVNASKVGYKKQWLTPVTIGTNNTRTELPAVTMEVAPVQLNGVTVTGKRPFIEQKIDRTIVNVAGSIIASGGTALEVLEKSPGISIDPQTDQIIFRGKEGVIVQIDGKQTYLSAADAVSLLRSMPAGNIDRIELISNPSARYDAAGNSGIIDIRLKKNNNIGTNGVINATGGSGRYARMRGNLQMNHRTSNINMFGNFAVNHENNYRNFELNRIITDAGQTNFINQHSFIRLYTHAYNTKTGIDYFISKKTTAGFVWTGIWDDTHETSPATANFRRQAAGDIYFQTLTDKSLSNIQANHLFNLNFVHAFNENHQLSADIDLGRFNRQFSNLLATQTLLPTDSAGKIAGLHSGMPSTITILTFKTDYTTRLWKKWKLETGVKISRVKSDNNMRLSTGINDNLTLDNTLSNHFLYAEHVYAGYTSVSGKLDTKTDLLLGLRAEYTRSTGNSITLNNVVNRNYLDLFPSLFINRVLNKNHTLNFSYSYRIDRPNYQSLNPARSYIDPYSYGAGNPFLKPQYTHSLEIKHGFKNKLFTALGASFTSDLVFFVLQPTDGKTTQRMPVNIGTGQSYYSTISFPVTVMKGWNMQTSLTATYSRFDYEYKSASMQSEQVSCRINNSHAFVFGKGFTGELSGRLSTPSTNVLTRSPWLGSVDAGIQKSFLKSWKAKLVVQDLFYTNYFIGRMNVPEFYSNVRISADSRVALLTITWAFGNQQLKSSRQRKTAADEEMQRTN